jgi:glycosyltransferase involved in cell wall biosynthesis
MSVRVDILLPTYKRADALRKNLLHLKYEIERDGLESYFSILISDNDSPDHTQGVVDEMTKDYPVAVNYYRQGKNIGLEANMVFILGQASAPYILWTGDDDYMAEGYLAYCVDKIRDIENLGLIIPGLASLHEDGTLVPGRTAPFAERVFAAGYASAWELSHMAHQMSGLLMRRENLLETYVSKPEYRNPYLFIQLATQCILSGQVLFAPAYPTAVTVFNEKDWGYNAIGLLDEVFKSYLFFRGQLTDVQIADLLVRFSVLHSYRYGIRWYRPARLIRQYFDVVKSIPSPATFRKKLALHLFKDYLKSFV